MSFGSVVPSALAAFELGLSLALALTSIQAVKYKDFAVRRGLDVEDYALLSILTLFVMLSSWSRVPYLWVFGAAAVLFLIVALWIDAVLFRVFTIELGTGGLGTVVISILYRELRELSFARRFFSSNGAFLFLPVVTLVALALPWMRAQGTPVRSADIFSTVVSGYFAWLLVRARRDLASRAAAYAMWVALAGCALLRGLPIEFLSGAPSHPTILTAGMLIPIALAAVALSGLRNRRATSFRRVSCLGRFFGQTPLRKARSFSPRREHEALLAIEPSPAPASAMHGALTGRSVILVTFESMGRDHLRAFSPRGASTPFIEGLLPHSVSSPNHFCISPNTNNAHLALYSSNYTENLGFEGLGALARAGYHTIYLSPIRTSDYGLKSLLQRAGFAHIVDRERLLPVPSGGTEISDYALLDPGIRRLEPLIRDGAPFFLHVHTVDTHVPYRVIDTARFSRHDNRDDRGRFFNGLEEGDWIVSELIDGLRSLLPASPILIISGDHGQAFGELGYQSHASAIIKEQINVPFLLFHPELPARRITHSSHLDLLPTVLDLFGIASTHPTFGRSIFVEDRTPCLLLWAGHPSRARSSNFGLILGERKLMVDLIAGRCYEMDWNDRPLSELSESNQIYYAELIHRMLSRMGLK